MNYTNDELLKKAFCEYHKILCDALPSGDQLDNITFSDKFLRRMQKLIRMQSKFYYPLINSISRRVACIIISIVTLTTITAFSVKAFREPCLDFISELFEKFTQITIREEVQVTENFIFEPKEPLYIPEGFKENYRNQYDDSLVIAFKNESNKTIFFDQNIKNDINIGINTEGSFSQNMTINGHQAIYYENLDAVGIVYTDDKYVFVINGEIEQKEMIKIIESIQK